MSPRFRIRRLAPTDSLSELTSLLNRAYRQLRERGLEYVATWQDEAITAKRIRNAECWIAKADGRMVGTITLQGPGEGRGHPWYERASVAKFSQFGVLPEGQGKGLGSALLSRAEARALALGAEEIACDTAEPAGELIEFYAQRGYRVVGRADFEPTNYESVILSKPLAPARRPAGSPIARFVAPLLLGAISVLMMHHPMLLSGMARAQENPGDTRLNNYFMEHGSRLIRGEAPHGDLWDMDFFYPVPGTGAYSDVMFSASPPYWLYRHVGLAPDTAFQWWMITMTALNFACFFYFLRRVFGAGVAAASVGATLFAAGFPRLAHLGHQALLGQVFVVLALTALGALFVRPEPKRVRGWIALFFAASVAQVYYGFYNALFLSLFLLLAGVIAFWFPGLRRRAFALGRGYGRTILLSAVLTALLLAPIAGAYLAVSEEVGARPWSEVKTMIPRPASWLYVDARNYVRRQFPDTGLFDDLPMHHEHVLGMGLLTLGVAVFGLAGSWRRPGVRLILIATVITVLSTTLVFGKAPIWRGIYNYYPAGDAIRAVARIGLWGLLPAALGLALFAGAAIRRRSWWRWLLIVLCLVEQAGTTGTFDKQALRDEVAEIEAAIRPESEAFFVTERGGPTPFWQIHINAMWAQMNTGVPTINGYSGHMPPGYDLQDVELAGAEEESEMADRLRRWAKRRGLPRDRIQWIRLAGGS